MSVKLEDFLTFLDQRKVKPECTYCGANNWAPGIEIEPNVYSTLGTMEEGGSITPARVVPLITMTCTNCCGIRAFSRLMFIQELQKKTQNEA